MVYFVGACLLGEGGRRNGDIVICALFLGGGTKFWGGCSPQTRNSTVRRALSASCFERTAKTYSLDHFSWRLLMVEEFSMVAVIHCI